MKSFNLKAKLLQAKDRATLALATGIVLVDRAVTEAIEAVSEVAEATRQTAKEVRRQVGEKVDSTTTVLKTKTDTVKGVTAEKLEKIGDSIDEKAARVSAATAEFGKAAKRTLATKNEPAAQETPAKKPAKPRAKRKTAVKAKTAPSKRWLFL